MKNKDIIIILSVLLVLTLPFLNRALAIDDIYVDSIADQIVNAPLDPYGFELQIQNRESSTAFDYTNPPLVSYYYALIQYFFGKNEIILHAFFMIFSITAAISMFYFSKNFTKWPLVAALLLVVSPIFIISSHNFMSDFPVLTFFLLSIITFIHGVDKDNKVFLILSGIFISLAFLTKYSALILFPLLIVYSILRRKAKYSLYLFIPIFLILLWSAIEVYTYGNVHIIYLYSNWHITGSFPSGIISKLFDIIIPYGIANLSYIGGASIFSIFMVYPFIKQRKDIILLTLLIIINLIFAYALYITSANFISGQYTIFQLLLVVIFVTSSSFFIIKMVQFIVQPINKIIKGGKYDKTAAYKIFLGLWFFLGLLFHTIVAGGTARYLTIILPPLILLFLMMFKECKINKSTITFIFIAMIVSNAIVSMAASVADYQYAEVYRDFAQNIPSQYTGSNVIFTGHEGFKYYMEIEGYTFYHPSIGELQKGDILIVPKIPVPIRLDNIKTNLILQDKIEYNTDFPLRTNNPWSHAGFYNYVNGLLPFSFSNKSLEVFKIYKFE